MRSMYRFSIIALAVASLALIVAGTAFAEGKFSGSVTTGIGQWSYTPGAPGGKSESGLTMNSEAIVNFSGGSGPITAKYRLEVTGMDSQATLNNSRNQVGWAISDALTLTMAGGSFGIKAGLAPYGATVVGHCGSIGGGLFCDYSGVTQWVFAVNDALVDVNFKAGAMDVGLVVSGDWDLRGGKFKSTSTTPGATLTDSGGDTVTLPDTTTTSSDAHDEAMTVVPYFNGSFGPVDVHAYMASASAKHVKAGTDTKEGITANELSLAGIFKGDGMKFALQYASGKYPTSTDSKGDVKTTGINLGGSVGPIGFHYISDVEEPDAGGDATKDVSQIAVAYMAAIGEAGSWAVQYGTQKDNLEVAKGGGDSMSIIMFSLQGKY